MTNTSSRDVRVLILGTGGMAVNHVRAYQSLSAVQVVAGVDPRMEVLKTFCQTHDIERQFTSLDEALAWGRFDAVSNVTPDSVHFDTTLAVLRAGKHVLCEKPLATSFEHALEMAMQAKAEGVVNMVNLVYRDVAVMQEAARRVRSGELGSIRHFEASYLQSWLTQPAWGDWRNEDKWLWRLSSAHGSHGVLGDVGVHILDFATYIADSLPVRLGCRLKTFAKAPGDRIGEYQLDANDSFVMHAELENGALGTISASRFASGHHNDLRLRVYGDKGGMEITFENQSGRLRVCKETDLLTAKWREVSASDVLPGYTRFVEAIREGHGIDPDFHRGAALQKILDAAAKADAGGSEVNLCWSD